MAKPQREKEREREETARNQTYCNSILNLEFTRSTRTVYRISISITVLCITLMPMLCSAKFSQYVVGIQSLQYVSFSHLVSKLQSLTRTL